MDRASNSGKSTILKRSLLLRVGIAMAILIALAVVGMLSSVIITQTSEGYAAAINQAGTLRMQSYRIATSLVHGTGTSAEYVGAQTEALVDEFEERLFSPRIHNVLLRQPSLRVEEAYRVVERKWREHIQPQLRQYVSYLMAEQGNELNGGQMSVQRQYYLYNVDDFVQSIHHFVKVLELDAEQKIQQLRLIQIVSLILILLVAIVSMYLTHKSILKPLKELLSCATAARHGDFSVRSQYLNEDELGQLANAFNVMAEDLSKIYADLEHRVHEKTADLERSNRSLELLYLTAKRLSESPPTQEVLQAVINDIEQQIDIRGGVICLKRLADQKTVCTATRFGTEVMNEFDCSRCYGDGTSHLVTLSQNRRPIFSTPIKDQDEQYGVLLIEVADGEDQALEDWQIRLLETVASHIALAINMERRAVQSRMVSLLEERSVIARELHDSLAQTLSYLKIQVSRLEKNLNDGKDTDEILMVSNVLRTALNGAYRQLRELLTTFRLRISEAGLGVALEDTVSEFRERSGIRIELDNRLISRKLNPNAEIHVLQIIREALSNVIRHADATHALVHLDCSESGDVTILVEDNGVGIASDRDMMLHYGLPIMKERAEWLGGELEISEPERGGTQVKLSFTAHEEQLSIQTNI
ncbi:MAG: type IV pili methyl-accepting chemotaxis transducer N-terminal domain-containing protein [Chromatiales bacterium]|nr:type IV pili methyl-accepting chemotaxis transducer N-terminal domain-containing protein [Chromatiales bacterium]